MPDLARDLRVGAHVVDGAMEVGHPAPFVGRAQGRVAGSRAREAQRHVESARLRILPQDEAVVEGAVGEARLREREGGQGESAEAAARAHSQYGGSPNVALRKSMKSFTFAGSRRRSG